ncbi:unnamed protein product [Ceratitis capitata]|uniref:(Mediterranean fruit fly) hypothetical protein n=4 Tax=Ceratitis capitata TaxID=7213 RepID=A0A811U996_CERCA|nr:unnamed protein product [Ceratitis capitata]
MAGSSQGAQTTTAAGSSAAATHLEQGKNTQKKSIEVRLFEEHEKRIRLLLTMETYIKSILVLMQRDESSASPTSGVMGGGTDDAEMAADVAEGECRRDACSISVAAASPTSSSAAITSDKKETKPLPVNEQSEVKTDVSESHNSPNKAHTSKPLAKEQELNSITHVNPLTAAQPKTTTTPTPTISAATAAALHSQQI